MFVYSHRKKTVHKPHHKHMLKPNYHHINNNYTLLYFLNNT